MLAGETEDFLGCLNEALKDRPSFSAEESSAIIDRLSILLSAQPTLRRVALIHRTSDPQQTELDDFSLLLDLRPIVDGSEIIGVVPLAAFRIAASAPDGRNAETFEVHISMEECHRITQAFTAFWQRFAVARQTFTAKNVAFLDAFPSALFDSSAGASINEARPGEDG
jgi:hypothetical protein